VGSLREVSGHLFLINHEFIRKYNIINILQKIINYFIVFLHGIITYYGAYLRYILYGQFCTNLSSVILWYYIVCHIWILVYHHTGMMIVMYHSFYCKILCIVILYKKICMKILVWISWLFHIFEKKINFFKIPCIYFLCRVMFVHLFSAKLLHLDSFWQS
jgi:hypothetical protein